MNITDFFDTDYCDFASYDNYRKIASVIDGNKVSARKCLHIIIQDNIKEPYKVQNLEGKISDKTNYIHGAGSLYGVIVGMAQNFVGTNNIPLFQRKGNFGNRIINDAAADRYIFTCKEKYLDNIFMPEDSEILIEQEFEGAKVEPKFFIPIIPMILVNGSLGLTTGFSQKILPRDPIEIIKWVKNRLQGKRTSSLKLIPHFNGFLGDVNPGAESGSWIINGKIEKKTGNKIEIFDVPCGPGAAGYDLKSYLAVLDKLVEDKKIKDYDDFSEGNKIHIVVQFWRNQGLDINKCDILSELKLSKSVTECYTCLDENNKVKEFTSVDEILNYYFDIRYSFYQKRKDLQLKKLMDKIYLEVSKYTFIKNVIEENIVLKNKSEDSVIKKLETIKNIITYKDSYDYLLNMPMSSITKEKYMKLKEDIKKLKEEYDILKKITVEEMWINDLVELERKLK